MLEAINLKTSLKPMAPLIGPKNLHDLPGLYFPFDQSVLQHQLSDLATFTIKNKMKINHKKTKIIPFNFSKSYDFTPQLHFPNSEALEVIYETKLLGVTITSNLSWSRHVEDICRRATKKLWVLVRFKSLGGTAEQLLTVYQTRIRSTLEFAAPVFHSGLTLDQSRQLEMVQKKALVIILGVNYINYESALSELHMERLDHRRTELCYSFAIKCTKSPKHNSMFPLNPNIRANSRNPKPYKEFPCKSSRYFNSPIPYLSRLLNTQAQSTKEAEETSRTNQ